jgi:hypothetical protein
MPVYSLLRRQCNCCRLNEECQAHRVTLRAAKAIPGCISPEYQPTFCEQNNVDERITDVAEKLCELGDRYRIGGYTPDGIRWIEAIGYDQWRRQYINYGLIRPKA